jgi:hypothetical protein
MKRIFLNEKRGAGRPQSPPLCSPWFTFSPLASDALLEGTETTLQVSWGALMPLPGYR